MWMIRKWLTMVIDKTLICKHKTGGNSNKANNCTHLFTNIPAEWSYQILWSYSNGRELLWNTHLKVHNISFAGCLSTSARCAWLHCQKVSDTGIERVTSRGLRYTYITLCNMPRASSQYFNSSSAVVGTKYDY